MKIFTLLSILFCLLATVATAQNETQKAGPEISFEETSFDFGDIKEGTKVTHVFKFKNTGNAPLVIDNVLTTCGCTVPEWPKEPVAPGKSGSITATFNSMGKKGIQNKVITIMSNAVSASNRVRIIANVLP